MPTKVRLRHRVIRALRRGPVRSHSRGTRSPGVGHAVPNFSHGYGPDAATANDQFPDSAFSVPSPEVPALPNGWPCRTDPAIALGRGLPKVPWFIPRVDRKYNVIMSGGQGSGKTSMLCRLALNDIYDPTTCTIVLDMKGSLSRRLLRHSPDELISEVPVPDADGGHHFEQQLKRVWYLDLEQPAFGMTPLRVESGWSRNSLAGEFSRIADAMTRVLLDLFPGQIMGSSEDIIERSTIGAMAIAWWEHEQDCAERGIDPTTKSFIGSIEVLASMLEPTARRRDYAADGGSAKTKRDPPNPWHRAAGKACQMLPNLDTVADDFLYGIPARVADNRANIAQRMEAPANKIRPLVGAAANARRFVEHRYHLSISELVRRRDVLIVNPRLDKLGEDQAAIICNFIIHLVDQEMKRQAEVDPAIRPRVSLIADEAHRLITDSLMTMVATHREAGFDCAFVVQFLSQIGASHPDAATRKKMLDGVGNLMQHKIVFRASSPDDAEYYASVFRSVYETMVRADPVSRSRVPADPSRISALADWTALVSLISSDATGNAGGTGESLWQHGEVGPASRLPVFTSHTMPMEPPENLSSAWADTHIRRQWERFPDYPENMSELARSVPPESLVNGTGEPPTRAQRQERVDRDAAEVADQDLGKVPGKTAPEPPKPDRFSEDHADVWDVGDDRDSPGGPSENGVHHPFTDVWDDAPKPNTPKKRPRQPAAAGERDDVQINERRAPADTVAKLRDLGALRLALLPTDVPLPIGDVVRMPSIDEAVKGLATIEDSQGRDPWSLRITDDYRDALTKLSSAVVTALPERSNQIASGPNPTLDAQVLERLHAAEAEATRAAKILRKLVRDGASGGDLDGLNDQIRDDVEAATRLVKTNRYSHRPLLEELARVTKIAAVIKRLPELLDALSDAVRAAEEAQVDSATKAVGGAVPRLREVMVAMREIPRAAQTDETDKLEDQIRALDGLVRNHRAKAADASAQLDPAQLSTLAIAARLTYVQPIILAELLDAPVADRTIRRHIQALEGLGMLAVSRVRRGGRGTRPAVYAVTERGRAVLRDRFRRGNVNSKRVPRELDTERHVPADGPKGDTMKHDLAVQAAVVALRHAAKEATVSWVTGQMSGGYLDPSSIHRDGLREDHLAPDAGVKVIGERIAKASRIEPDVTVQLTGPTGTGHGLVDLMLEVDRTRRGSYNAEKFVAYDHFLAGWWRNTRRYGSERKHRPIVVFVAQKPDGLRTLMNAADAEMRVGLAPRAVYDESEFWYPGREHVAFTTLEWLLGGQLKAQMLQPFPPRVRGTEFEDAPSKVVDLITTSWWLAGAK